MGISWTHVLIAGVWGGLCAVERRGFLQAMFSRPLVAATVMGMVLGDVPAGIAIGMVLELYYLGAAALGAARPENDTLTATGAAAGASCLALGNGADSTPAIWSLCILGFAPLGILGRLVDRRLEQYSATLAVKALSSAEQGHLRRAVRQNLWGMWPHFFIFGLLTSSCALIGFVLAPYERQLPHHVLRGLALAFPAIASVAAAIAARGSHAKKSAAYAGLAASMVVVVTFVLYRMGTLR